MITLINLSSPQVSKVHGSRGGCHRAWFFSNLRTFRSQGAYSNVGFTAQFLQGSAVRGEVFLLSRLEWGIKFHTVQNVHFQGDFVVPGTCKMDVEMLPLQCL